MGQNTVRELLAKLALDAMKDRDSLEVFADAVLEHGWFDPRPPRLIAPKEPDAIYWQREYARKARFDRESPSWQVWPKACAAVLLFGGDPLA